ncbi:MAG: FAD:protein FMN transferase [bacterium]|nr:FAD:protein FMN transferase [bacterium]
MKLSAILLALLLAGSGAEPIAAGEIEHAVVFKTRTMGTVASLTLVTADSAAVADLAYEALLSLHHTDSLMTNWTETSETARVNRLAGTQEVVLDQEFNRVLTLAGQVGEASAGAFDVTVEPLVRLWGFLAGRPAVPAQQDITAALVPTGWRQLAHDGRAGTLRFRHPDTRIDLGGIAKGYGVDRVAENLRGAGVADALIDLSGNMIAMGAPPDRTGWTLGIQDPAGRFDYLARLRLHDEAVATSGNYLQYVVDPEDPHSRRYGHILDPRTGWPADGMASVTVIAADAATADAWATAFIVLGEQEARTVAAEHAELKVILIERVNKRSRVTDRSQVIWVEEILRGEFVLREGLDESIQVRFF